MIYAFTGKKNSGKNTAASMVNFLVNGYSFKDWKFSEWKKGEPWSLTRLKQYKDKYYNFISKEDVIKHLGEYIAAGDLKMFFEEKSFAGKVKDVCSILTGIPREDWDNRELRDKKLEIEGLLKPHVLCQFGSHERGNIKYSFANVDNYTYRTFMQRVGTEAMRDCIHQDVWVNALMQEYKQIGRCKGRCERGWDAGTSDTCIDDSYCINPQYSNWVITDLRFDNEAKAVKAVGGIVIEIDRNSSTDNDPHASEQAIHTDYVDHFIGNNSTLEELFDKIKLVLNDRSNTRTNL